MGRPKLRSLVRDCAGAAAIEFAIVGNAFLMFLIGTAYLAVILWHAANLDWAVETAARLAVLNSSVSQSDITAAVNDYLADVGMGSADVQYTVTSQGGVNVGEISASKTEDFGIPFFSDRSITFHASANVPQP